MPLLREARSRLLSRVFWSILAVGVVLILVAAVLYIHPVCTGPYPCPPAQPCSTPPVGCTIDPAAAVVAFAGLLLIVMGVGGSLAVRRPRAPLREPNPPSTLD